MGKGSVTEMTFLTKMTLFDEMTTMDSSKDTTMDSSKDTTVDSSKNHCLGLKPQSGPELPLFGQK